MNFSKVRKKEIDNMILHDPTLRFSSPSRNIAVRIKNHMIIRKIEKALNIRLMKWQKAYILGLMVTLPSYRQIGKTLAHCVKVCITPGLSLDMRFVENVLAVIDESNTHLPYSKPYRRGYVQELFEVYTKLSKANICKREISFPPFCEIASRSARFYFGVDLAIRENTSKKE